MSRAYTAEEVRDQFLDHCHSLVDYWLNESRTPDVKDKMNGLVFSILNIFDGTTAALPAFDIIPSPHPSDKAYCQSNGDNWYEAVVINDCHLHDEWYK